MKFSSQLWLLSHLQKDNQQHQISGEGTDLSYCCYLHFFFFWKTWVFDSLEMSQKLGILTFEQRPCFWSKEGTPKPHLLLAQYEETIAVLYILQTCCCFLHWYFMLNGIQFGDKKFQEWIEPPFTEGSRESKICLKIMKRVGRFKNIRIFSLKTDVRVGMIIF